MVLARRSGQPFAHMLRWHPRDVDTLEQLYHDDDQRAEDQAREARFAAMAAELRQRMGGGFGGN